MPTDDVSTLSPDEPLYDFLVHDVFAAALDLHPERPAFRVDDLADDAPVRCFTEEETGVSVVCKFYGRKPPASNDDPGPEYFRKYVYQEFDNMRRALDLGLDEPPYRVVRPYAVREALDFVLAEEFVEGEKLDAFIGQALGGDGEPLKDRLAELAGFFARLHPRSAQDHPADADETLDYFDKVVGQLADDEILTGDERDRLRAARDRWAASGVLATAPEVLLHGDATPINFVFPEGEGVVAIDLERMWPGDAMRDVGGIVAELRHAFIRANGDTEHAEPFVGHFLGVYDAECAAADAPDERAARLDFWTCTTTLRIARNDWFDLDYRRHLVGLALRRLEEAP